MPETGRQKQQLSNQLVGLDAHRMENVDSNELEIDGSRYFHPGEEHKDGGVFGATRILVNDRADWIVVKQSNGMVDANGRTIGNTIEKEAAFSRLADAAANGGKSRVAAARAIGRSKEDGEPDLLVMDLMVGGNVKRMTEGVIARLQAKQLTYEDVALALVVFLAVVLVLVLVESLLLALLAQGLGHLGGLAGVHGVDQDLARPGLVDAQL